MIDYRHDGKEVSYYLHNNTNNKIKEISKKIHSYTNMSFFDIDYCETYDGNIIILEWNTSPCPTVFSKQLLAHKVPIFTLAAFALPDPVVI